jgi:altronate dehydratase small subunit
VAPVRAIRLDPQDTVAAVLADAPVGSEIAAECGDARQTVIAVEAIPFGFKVALEAVAAGGTVRKYGAPIGRASQPIKAGQLVHIHNLEGIRGRGDLAGASE